MIFYSGSIKLINKRIKSQDKQTKSSSQQKSKLKMKENQSQKFKQNIEKVQKYVQQQKDPRLQDFFKFLQNQYQQGSKKINIGSIYQMPVGAKGIDVLMKFCYWEIETLNLTMHNIHNQGLQNLIKHGKELSNPLSQLKELSIIKNGITSEGFDGIENVKLPALKTLMGANNSIDHVAIYKFIKSEWPLLEQLHLSNNKIGKQGCKLLMQSKWLKFRKLDLNYNMIGNQGVHYLSEADWPNLADLNLSNNKIDAKGTYYMKNANWPQLKSILMNRNQIGMQNGKITLVGCINLCQLKTNFIQKLSLYGNQIILNGILIILNSQKLVPGCFMELSRNHFKFQEIRETLKILDKFCNQFQN